MHSGSGSCSRVTFCCMCSQPTFDHLLSAGSLGIKWRVSPPDWSLTFWLFFFFLESDWVCGRPFWTGPKKTQGPLYSYMATTGSQEGFKHPLSWQAAGELASPWEPLSFSGSLAVSPEEASSSSSQTPDHLNLRRLAPPSSGPCRSSQGTPTSY